MKDAAISYSLIDIYMTTENIMTNSKRFLDSIVIGYLTFHQIRIRNDRGEVCERGREHFQASLAQDFEGCKYYNDTMLSYYDMISYHSNLFKISISLLVELIILS
jgi:hypothetical protein